MPPALHRSTAAFLLNLQTLVRLQPRLECRPGLSQPREPPELDILDWEPPTWLLSIYREHAGIGPYWPGIGWGRPTLLPWEEVRPLTAWIRFGEENITFDPADSVLLTPDSRGGGVVLSNRDAPVLQRFDGQRHRLGDEISVDAYLNGLLDAWRSL